MIEWLQTRPGPLVPKVTHIIFAQNDRRFIRWWFFATMITTDYSGQNLRLSVLFIFLIYLCVYISRRLPVTKFNPPDNFLSLLSSQVYGPTTQIIASDVSTSFSFQELKYTHVSLSMRIIHPLRCIYRSLLSMRGTQRYKYPTRWTAAALLVNWRLSDGRDSSQHRPGTSTNFFRKAVSDCIYHFVSL